LQALCYKNKFNLVIAATFLMWNTSMATPMVTQRWSIFKIFVRKHWIKASQATAKEVT